MIQEQSLLEKLAWQCEAGADEPLEEIPGFRHWTVPVAKTGRVTVAPLPAPERHAEPFLTIKPLRESAPTPAPLLTPPPVDTLEALRAALDGFDGAGLKSTAISLVFADGNPKASVMIMGDVPAEAEDRSGIPFSGANGQLLDKMLAAIGLDRTQVYLTNLLFWRPPGNRTPLEKEVAGCLPWTAQHIGLHAPKFLVLMGALTTKTLLRSKEPFSKLHGRWHTYRSPLPVFAEQEIPCLPMYHPAYLLNQPAAKKQAWADLLTLKKALTKLSD